MFKKKPPLRFWGVWTKHAQKKALTPLWFCFGTKHVERTNNHPRNMFVWYKRMHQNKKRPHRYAFLSHQKRAKIKSGHAAIHATKKMQQSHRSASSLIFYIQVLQVRQDWTPYMALGSAPQERLHPFFEEKDQCCHRREVLYVCKQFNILLFSNKVLKILSSSGHTALPVMSPYTEKKSTWFPMSKAATPLQMQTQQQNKKNPPTPLWRWRRAYWGATATLNPQWHLLI